MWSVVAFPKSSVARASVRVSTLSLMNNGAARLSGRRSDPVFRKGLTLDLFNPARLVRLLSVCASQNKGTRAHYSETKKRATGK